MEPGLYYHQAIFRDFEVADRQATAAEKEKDERIRIATAAYEKAISAEFCAGKGEISKPYSNTWDRNVSLAPGVVLKIDASELDKSTKTGRALLVAAEIEEGVSRLCAIRCKLREMMDTAMVNKFKAFVRSIHSVDPTDAQLRQAVTDFRILNEAHTCPVPTVKRRR